MRLPILAGALLLLLLLATLLPSMPVWITDNGNKYIVLDNLSRRLSPTIESSAIDFDPEHRFLPDGNFHFQVMNGEVRSIYPEFFSALALPGYLLFGEAGIWILPIGGTMAVLAFFLALLSRFGLSPKQEAVCCGLLLCGTPLLFYSGTFWEMTLATVFPLAAILAARNRQLFLAGILLGAGLWLREEFYLIALAAGIAALAFYPRFWRRCIPFGLGFLALALPLWIYNVMVYGHILGLHGALYYTHNVEVVPTLTEQMFGVLEGIFIYLFKFNSGNPETVWYYWVALLPMFLLPVAGFLRNAETFKLSVAWAAVVSWAFLLWCFWFNPASAYASGLTVGFVTSSPLLAGFFLHWRDLLCRGPRPRRMIVLASLLYCLALPLVLTRSDIGIIWGARHYLLIFPVLFLLSVIGFARMKKSVALAVALILAALTLQAIGIRSLFGVAEDVARAEETIIQNSSLHIVSDVFFLPEQTPRAFSRFNARWFYLKNDSRIDELLSMLRSHGVKEFTLILSPSPNFRQLSDDGVRRLLGENPVPPRVLVLPAPGSQFMELLIVQCHLQ